MRYILYPLPPNQNSCLRHCMQLYLNNRVLTKKLSVIAVKDFTLFTLDLPNDYTTLHYYSKNGIIILPFLFFFKLDYFFYKEMKKDERLVQSSATGGRENSRSCQHILYIIMLFTVARITLCVLYFCRFDCNMLRLHSDDSANRSNLVLITCFIIFKPILF